MECVLTQIDITLKLKRKIIGIKRITEIKINII